MTVGTTSPSAGPPRFSQEEMAGRAAALDEVMRGAEVEHVVVYGANRSGSGGSG